jgi:hypothetical protein
VTALTSTHQKNFNFGELPNALEKREKMKEELRLKDQDKQTGKPLFIISTAKRPQKTKVTNHKTSIGQTLVENQKAS